jgi:hypothetical protein
MLDHLHFFATSCSEAKSRAQWLKSWKSISARQLIGTFGVVSPFWQADTFDHIMRSIESYSQKWDYMKDNPVRECLVVRSEDWPWQGEIHPLAFPKAG